MAKCMLEELFDTVEQLRDRVADLEAERDGQVPPSVKRKRQARLDELVALGMTKKEAKGMIHREIKRGEL